ncbi:ATP-binding cassette domain-containing protein, partial [Streptomyces cyaneofuscatus]
MADALPRPLPDHPDARPGGDRRSLAGPDQPAPEIGADAVTADHAANPAVLDVRDLSVRFRMRGGRDIAAVTGARFSVAPGECLALVGESGCGKSVLASALLGLLPANAQTTGSAVLGGDIDLLTAGE